LLCCGLVFGSVVSLFVWLGLVLVCACLLLWVLYVLLFVACLGLLIVLRFFLLIVFIV